MFFFFQAEDGIRDYKVTGVQTCALPILFRLELFLQLCLATLFGGAIGLERELGGKPAGLRTNILICIGSMLYTKLSSAMAAGTADPTRIAAQIVTGVGFIGAGTILHARGAGVGLTSAGTSW